MIVAGGTGGHIFPGLAVADALLAKAAPVTWLGALGGMEEDLVQRHQIPFDGIAVNRLRGQGLLRWLLAPLAVARSVLQAALVLRKRQPRCVLALGGFAAGPGGLAAWLLRIPLVVHEQNRIPGLTNRVLMRLAKRRFFGLDGCFAQQIGATAVGNPVRHSILDLPAPARRRVAMGPLRLLVLGGSQGARFLNQTVPQALALLPAINRPQVLHQCGAGNLEQTREAYRQAGVEARCHDFLADMAATYANADLAICRSGALTVAELAATGLASVLVPFPHAVDDHQTANAQWLVDHHAAKLMAEGGGGAQAMARILEALLADPGKLREMARSARALAPAGAAENVAQTCLEATR